MKVSKLSFTFKMILIALIFFYLQQLTFSVKIRLSKLECLEYDKSFLHFKSCNLKVLGRNRIGANVYVQLFKKPLDNIIFNGGVYVKSSTQKYTPLLYNNTLNLCSFLHNKNRMPHWKLIFDIVAQFSNINHSCPFNHDIIVKDLVLNSDMLKFTPFPSGDYLMKVRAGVHKDFKAEVLVYVNIKE